MDYKNIHSFAVLAYKEVPYLKKTLESVLAQNISSDVYISTSTPTEEIKKIAAEYNVRLYINTGKSDMMSNWEFALSCANTPLVTLTHQDDIYHKDYSETMVSLLNSVPNSLIAFSNYVEIDGTGASRKTNKTLFVKRLMLWPFIFKKTIENRIIKKIILRFGNPICAPSVTYNLKNLGSTHLFDESYAISLDWDAWLRMAENKGVFCYAKKPLISRRIHEASGTTEGIIDGQRYEEDLRIYKRMWPKWIAILLTKRYTACYKTNEVFK